MLFSKGDSKAWQYLNMIYFNVMNQVIGMDQPRPGVGENPESYKGYPEKYYENYCTHRKVIIMINFIFYAKVL